MLPIVEKNSVVYTKYMNSFFESFEERKNEGFRTYVVKTSIRDVVDADGKGRFFNNYNYGKYHYIKTCLIQDKTLYDQVDETNYLDLLENNSSILIVKKSLVDFLGDKENIFKHRSEIIGSDASVYKLFYDSKFAVKSSDFLGFVTYVYFDTNEFAIENNLNGLSIKEDNKNFRIDKHALLTDGVLNKSKQALVTSGGNLWYSTFNGNSSKYYAKVNDINYDLTLEYYKIKVTTDFKAKFVPPSEEITNVKKETSKDDHFEYNASIGKIVHSKDSDGDLKIYFPFDVHSFTSKRSMFYRVLNRTIINDIASADSFKQLNNIVSFDIYRKRIDNGEMSNDNISTTETPDLNIYTNSDLKNVTNDIIFYQVTDYSFKYLKGGSYEYFLRISVRDGFREYFKTLIEVSRDHLEDLKSFLKYAEIKSYKEDANGVGVYYDYNNNSFTEEFIIEQEKEDSLWKKCQVFALSYKTLFNLIEPNPLDADLKDVIYDSVDPMYSSLESIQNIANGYDTLIRKANSILDSQGPVTFNKEYKLIPSITPTRQDSYYAYFDGDDYTGFIKDPYFSFKPPKKIVNLLANYGLKQIITYEENLYGDLNNFNITQQGRLMVIDSIQKKFNSDNIAFYKDDLLFYELLSEYLPYMYNLSLNKPKFSTVDQLKTYTSTNFDIDTLKSIYFTLNENELLPKDISASEITDKIFNFLNLYAPFYLEFFSKHLADPSISTNFYGDAQKVFFFSIFFGKGVKIEYLDSFERNGDNKLLLKNEVWKLLDKSTNPIKLGTSVLVRLVPVDLSQLSFVSDPKTDLDIINRYVILRAE